MKNNITVYLMGGLGNVMFQLNYAYHLRSQGFSVDIGCILLNQSFLSNKLLGWSNHGTSDILNSLNLLDDFHCHSSGGGNIIAAGLSKVIGHAFFSTCFYGRESPVAKDIKSRHLFGYFHINNPINEYFVKKAQSALLRHVKKSDLMHVDNILQEIDDDFVVHVRGGDYRADPNFSIDDAYYMSALSGRKKCFIITNDEIYSRKLFKNIPVEYSFVNTGNAIEDFFILAMCRNKILANSTFSWWAAELGCSDGLILQRDPFFSHIKDWRPDSKISRKVVSAL